MAMTNDGQITMFAQLPGMVDQGPEIHFTIVWQVNGNVPTPLKQGGAVQLLDKLFSGKLALLVSKTLSC